MPSDRVIDGQSFASQLLGKSTTPVRDWVYSQYREKFFVRGSRYRLNNEGELHDMKVDRYNPELVPRAVSLPRNNPDSEATEGRMRLREVILELGQAIR